MFAGAQWIWSSDNFGENEYVEFLDTFVWSGDPVRIRLSVCGDYTLFVNGRYVASNQYGDFAHYKVYDEMDITRYLQAGENSIGILVWYFGAFGMRYFTPMPGLIYEVLQKDQTVAASDVTTLSRKSRAYVSGSKKTISPQLGYSFSYDSTKEDRWLDGVGKGFGPSCVIQSKQEFYQRPVEKLILGSFRAASFMKVERVDGRYVYTFDLGEETVGLPSFSMVTKKEQDILVAYGELLKNGHVKRLIGNRDFSFDYRAGCGENTYINYMFRLACRYIEIESEEPIEIKYIGIVPQNYAVKEKKFTLENTLDQQIYDICVNTLKLCMLEHYVDCPWREQCLYAYDARNQMLVGYLAFEGGNFEYARANLLLMSKDDRPDGLLSICFPSGSDLTIPAFSLYYILAVKEYLEYSGDLSLGEEVFEKIESILEVFVNNMRDGLVCRFEGVSHWNFYDWSKYAESEIGRPEKDPDLMLNCIMIIALHAYGEICRYLSRKNVHEGLSEKILERARKEYYNEKTGVFFVADSEEEPTELVNSFAVLTGVAQGQIAENICEALAADQMISCSLSMKTFKYNALLKVDREKYTESILSEIRTNYKCMLDAGSTTVWEVTQGGDTWGNAGSLCHGWSAIPIYYYYLFQE